MNDVKPTVDDDRFQNAIGNLLRLGVLLAAGVVLLGGVIYLFKFGSSQPDYVDFTENPDLLNGLKGIFSEAFRFHSQGVIQLGLLILIATPIARVAFSFVAFLRQKDYLYTIVTMIVLCILIFGFFSGQL